MKNNTLRFFAVSLVFFFAMFIQVRAAGAGKSPRPSNHLHCPVNAGAGKRASVQTTHIRKKIVQHKRKPARPAPAPKQRAAKAPKVQKQKEQKAPQQRVEKTNTQKARPVSAPKHVTKSKSRTISTF